MTSTLVPRPDNGTEEDQSIPVRKRAFQLVREITAILFWIYAICKLFIFDIDVYITSHIDASLIWILDYKLLFFLAIIAILAIFVNTCAALWYLAFVILYPLILLFWRLPYFIYKQKSWLLLFHLINSVASFVRTFRYRVITIALFVIAFSICVTIGNKAALYGASAVIVLLLAVTFVRVFLDLARPNAVFKFYKTCFSWFGATLSTNWHERDQIKGLPVASMSETQAAYPVVPGSSICSGCTGLMG